MNTFSTPTWVIREGLTHYFKNLGMRDFADKISAMTESEVLRLNDSVCRALSDIDWDDSDDE